MRHPAPRTVAALVASLLATGCPSLSTLHTARPVPEGETEAAFAVGAYAFREDGEDHGDELLPFFEGSIRRGYGPRVDAGVRVTALSMIGVDVNWALLLGERYAVSIDPQALALLGPVLVSYLWLPVLVDLDLDEDTTLTLSGRIGRAFLDTVDEDNDVGLEGEGTFTGFGIGLRRRTGARWALLPEAHVIWPSDGSLSEDALLSLSLGVTW